MEEQQPHQPAPADRADRQGRGRAVLADRPAERHGRPRGRTALAISCRATASSRTPKHRPRSSTFWGRPPGSIVPEAGPDARSRCSRPWTGAAQGDLDRGHQPARSACPTCTGCGPGWRRPSWSSCRTRTTRPRRRGWRTSSCPSRQWGEKESTTTNSERMVSRSARRLWDPPGEALPDWQILCEVRRPAWGSPTPSTIATGVGRVGRVHPPDRAAGRATWPGSRRAGSTTGPLCSGRAPTRTTTGPSGATSTRPSRRPDGRAVFLPRDAPRPVRADGRRVPVRADDRPHLRPLAHPDAHGQGRRS